MQADLFSSNVTDGDGLAFVEPGGTTSWSELQRLISVAASESPGESQATDLPTSSTQVARVGLQLSPTCHSLVQFFALMGSGAHVFLMAPQASRETVQDWATEFGLQAVKATDGANITIEGANHRAGTPGAVTILTSGTTGKPKAAEHTWQGLCRPVRQSDAIRGTRWLLTFRPHLYAGLQVMLQCLLNRGTLVMPTAESGADAVVQLAADAGVEYASATPSYWRWLLTFAGDRIGNIPLKQITLGGEAVDQATLDALRTVFPNARLVHIYATTELGRCFSVTDGLEGFPSRFLEETSADGVQMRVEDSGELVVRSANAMNGYDGATAATADSPQSAWFPTGDLVEPIGDRYRFVGRVTEMINVGGNKVYPLEVENFLRTIPGIADARVYGEASSIVGELVKCDVVLADGFEERSVKAEIQSRAVQELTTYQRPRFIAIVDEIARTAAGKTKR